MHTLLLEGPGPFQPETLLGALCDLGASPSAVEWELGKLALAPYHLHFERETEGGVRFTAHPGAVHTHDQDAGEAGADEEPAPAPAAHDHDHGASHHHHDHDHDHGEEDGHGDHEHHHHGHEGEETALADVVELIERSDLSPFVRSRAIAALGPLEEGFGEDEALVAFVSVIGALAAMEALEVGALFCEVHLFAPGIDPVGKILLDGLGFRPVPTAGFTLAPTPRTGLGLGRRPGHALKASLGEPA